MTITTLVDKAAACGLRPPEWLSPPRENDPHWYDLYTAQDVSKAVAESILRGWAVRVMAEAGIAVYRDHKKRWWTYSDELRFKCMLDATDRDSAVYAAFVRYCEQQTKEKV